MFTFVPVAESYLDEMITMECRISQASSDAQYAGTRGH
jgi:hypothetical protein